MLTVKKAIEELSKYPPNLQLAVWMPGSVVVLNDKPFIRYNDNHDPLAVMFEGNQMSSSQPWHIGNK